jgi:aryl-alcohol dehydrogenase-like predicted oxidoreductase
MVTSPLARTRLGRTGLSVCPIGIGCGMGISSADIEYAIDRGLNYVFYSSDLHSQTYQNARDVLREYCRRGSARRDSVVLAACSYLCDPEKIFGAIVDQLSALRIDHVDVFFWGWVTRQNAPGDLIRKTQEVVRTSAGRAEIDALVGTVRQVADELRCRGYARHLGISTHDRSVALELADDPNVDVLMFRYNIAHRGAEDAIFPRLAGDPNRPGVVAFNTTHNAKGTLTALPEGVPPLKYRPTHADLYRFALERPEVDLVLTGPRNRADVDHAVGALTRPPLEPRMVEYLRTLGDLHAGRVVMGPVAAGVG